MKTNKHYTHIVADYIEELATQEFGELPNWPRWLDDMHRKIVEGTAFCSECRCGSINIRLPYFGDYRCEKTCQRCGHVWCDPWAGSDF